MKDILSRFVRGGEANLYGPPETPSGDARRSFTSLVKRMAHVGVAASVILNIVVPQASAAEPVDPRARMASAVERIEGQVGLDRRMRQMADSHVAACFFVRVTEYQSNSGGPDPAIGDRALPKVFYVRVTNCELSNELYERRKAEFEKQAGMALGGPDVDLRKVERKAAMLGMDLQKPMGREEAFALRDAGNERILRIMENQTWGRDGDSVEEDGVHLSVRFNAR